MGNGCESNGTMEKLDLGCSKDRADSNGEEKEVGLVQAS